MDYRNRAALGWICERLRGMYTLADRAGKRAELDVILSGLRNDQSDLGRSLEQVEDLLRRCGWGGAVRSGSPPGLGLGTGFSLEEAYVCPRKEGLRCTRAVPAIDVNGEEGPWCDINEVPLRLDQYGR